MASPLSSQKTIETHHYSDGHITTESAKAGKNQKVTTILRGNGVEPNKSKIYSQNMKY